jgi:hypothetical protein
MHLELYRWSVRSFKVCLHRQWLASCDKAQ